MAGTMYLRTNRFEVKLEAMTFKTKDFESICKMDFLFPDRKVWDHPPIVGLDVMNHPRDPSVILVLLCFGVGCLILRFPTGEPLPLSIYKFLSDKRIHFVGFGIPEKNNLFPFEELGLTKCKVDIGYLASNIFKDSKYKKWDLTELARKVLGVKRMIGVTESSSFERHEQIKCAICQLFITSVIAMGLFGAKEKEKSNESSFSFLKNLKSLNSMQLLAEGWFKLSKDKKNIDNSDSTKKNSFLKNLSFKNLNSSQFIEEWLKFPIRKKKNQNNTFDDEQDYIVGENDEMFGYEHGGDSLIQEDSSNNDFFLGGGYKAESSNGLVSCAKANSGNSKCDSSEDACRKPIKGILKCPSMNLTRCNSSVFYLESSPSARGQLRRANSKGCNVSFKFHH